MKNFVFLTFMTLCLFSCSKENINWNDTVSDNTVLALQSNSVDREEMTVQALIGCSCSLIVNSNRANSGNMEDWLIRFEYTKPDNSNGAITFGGTNGTYQYPENVALEKDFKVAFSAKDDTNFEFATFLINDIPSNPGNFDNAEITVNVRCQNATLSGQFAAYTWEVGELNSGFNYPYENYSSNPIIGTINNCAAKEYNVSAF